MSRLNRFLELLQNYETRPCIDGQDVAYTYSQLLKEYECWQSRLDEMHVKPGSVVGVQADYSPAAIACLLALLARNAVAALIPRDLAATQYLADAHVSSLLKLDVEGRYCWSGVTDATTHPLLEQLRAAGEGGVIIFTSGTTGRPKAALQSVERLLYKFEKPGRRFRTLAFLLFDHVAGLDTLLYTLVSGGTLILTRRRDPRSILNLIDSHQVEVLPASPSFLRLLCATNDSGQHGLSSLKIITYGSEPMDAGTLARLNTRFPQVQLSQKYGTTELGSPRSISRANDSLWLKIKNIGVEMKVIDGVLWLRSEGMILGYLNAPSPVDAQGWYCTGDMVDVDGEWIRFRGRVFDYINVGGEKVTPTEVEQSILELDFVRDVLVSGEPHALLGQIVAAKVALATADMEPKEAVRRIRLHCRERLAPHKVPIDIQITAAEFINSRQKVERKHVRLNSPARAQDDSGEIAT